jgi:2-iminobutanoate/2-iminopropanoate deaminase
MIARTWGGKVPLEHAEGFHQHLLVTGVEDYRGHRDCIEVKLLRRDAHEWAHFLLFSVWISMDAILGYAGDAPERAVLYPDDDAFGLVPDLEVTHYELLSVTATGEGRLAEFATRTSKATPSHTSHRLATPVGPFAHAAHTADMVYLSGQVGQDPASGRLIEGGISAQTHQSLANLRTVLEERGLGFSDVVKVNVFLSDMAAFGEMNAIYAEYFMAPFPARTTVAVRGLPLSALVEFEAVARRR